MADVEEYNQQKPQKTGKQHNVLPIWGNEQTMNLNPLILANIQGSSYFKVHLFKLKTYHEVVDEIYYQVKHLEPWERGSRKTAGQTGMCGGVRGVGAGGIVSTAFCLLYKLYTLRLTRKQLNGLLTHTDSPYIRALGFMYIRYTQPPADLMDWYEEYFEDEEEIEPRAGGGSPTTIGVLVRQMLTKLDWFSTLFPRIPVPIQKMIENKLAEYNRNHPPVVKPAQNFRGGGGAGGGGAGSGAREGYNRADNGAREGYNRVSSAARDGYNRAASGAREGYNRASSGARDSYNPRTEPDRREHDDRDRRDYSDGDRYSKEKFKRDDRDRTRDRDRDGTHGRDRDRHRERRDRLRELDRRHRSRSRDRRHR